MMKPLVESDCLGVEIEPMPSLGLSFEEWYRFEPPQHTNYFNPCDHLRCVFHEAGHVLLFLIFKIPFVSVELDPGTNTLMLGSNQVEYLQINGVVNVTHESERKAYKKPGRKNEKEDRSQVDQWLALEFAAMYAAGHQAELILHGIKPDGYVWRDRDNDYYKLSDVLQYAFGHERHIYFVQRFARHHLTKNWALVHRIALDLWAKRKLDRKDVLDIVKTIVGEEWLSINTRRYPVEHLNVPHESFPITGT